VFFGAVMALSLSIKNVPIDIADAVKQQAIANHRSLQGELMAILEAAVNKNAVNTQAPIQHQATSTETAVAVKKHSVAEIGMRLRQVIPVTLSTPLTQPPATSSAEIIRHMRSGRDGTQWQDPTHHEKGY
jgi:plasmid stability protein